MRTVELYAATVAAVVWKGEASWLTIGLALAASVGGIYHAARWAERE